MLTALNHITLAVKDLDKSFDFYKNILGLKPICKWDKGAYFLLGDFWFCLNVDSKRLPTECYTHYAFSVSPENFPTMSETIIASGIYIFKENTSPGDSLYFLDPDGHKLEIHTSNWQTRMEIKKQNPGNWQKVEWFA